jgi:LmbE family N-acetylglucosaminyl deacetylase
MDLVVDEAHLGTSEEAWLSSVRLQATPSLTGPIPQRVVVVAPHPDDEIFGAAGLLQTLPNHDVTIIAVSDGEASHPGVTDLGCDLRSLRVGESRRALDRLGRSKTPVVRLGLPDGAVASHAEHLVSSLTDSLSPGDLCVAPWRLDGHPDHDACGRAAAEAVPASGAVLLEYLVWAWHWLEPEDDRLPWEHCRRIQLSRRQAAYKRWATHAFTSQLRPLYVEPAGSALLPAPVVRRFWRRFEVFIDHRGTA